MTEAKYTSVQARMQAAQEQWEKLQAVTSAGIAHGAPATPFQAVLALAPQHLTWPNFVRGLINRLLNGIE